MFTKPKKQAIRKQVKAFNFDKLDPVDEYEWRGQYSKKRK
jgi:hypothetical protein